MTTNFAATLAALAAEVAHPRAGGAQLPAGQSPAVGAACSHAPETVRPLADRDDGTVVRHGAFVAKGHAPDTDSAALDVRIAVAAHPLLSGVLLAPLPLPTPLPRPPSGQAPPAPSSGRAARDRARPLSLWPYGTPVDPAEPDAAPWEETAVLLARLHRTDTSALPGPLPPMRGPAKAARAVARMLAARPHPAVLAAWRGLPARARNEAPDPGRTLCHGDLHLGQLVRHPAPDGPWHLIDVDDLGLGDPAWDLARPAAWYAAGLLAPDVWQRFLAAYRAAGGPAVRPEGDPWPELDVAARALTVQTAALALAKSTAEDRPLDEVEQLMIDACARIAQLRPGNGGALPA
ncbi:phosphotransferase family protein [Streptomyces sp. NPDC004111]|uniref:phosphotransferase family protein n=1 Tax=Streptomyces sp. NPDC004111 TaxID=3364690 RepID=UPI0036879124